MLETRHLKSTYRKESESPFPWLSVSPFKERPRQTAEDSRAFVVSQILVSLLSEKLDKIVLRACIWTVCIVVSLQALENDDLCLNHRPVAE